MKLTQTLFIDVDVTAIACVLGWDRVNLSKWES